MAKLATLHDIFEHEILDLHSAEEQLIKALPMMADKATNSELKNGFIKHLDQTKYQLERLKTICKDMEFDTSKKETCKAMEGILKEAIETLEKSANNDATDVILALSASRIEHYEISGYTSAIAHAECMGHDDAVELLNETLIEENEAEEMISNLSENELNDKANDM